jgi:hypothetical protein
MAETTTDWRWPIAKIRLAHQRFPRLDLGEPHAFVRDVDRLTALPLSNVDARVTSLESSRK